MSAPEWVSAAAQRLQLVAPESLSRHDPPADGTGQRQAAVLILLGEDERRFVVLAQRSDRLRKHAGQIAFPGGSRDPDDDGPVGTALREAHEEAGIEPASVEPLHVLPTLLIPVTGFEVTAVLGWWRAPGELIADGTETERVVRVALDDLQDGWYEYRHPVGWHGLAIDHALGTIWGYTADMLRAVIDAIGDD